MILRGLTCLKRRDTFIPIAKISCDHGVILKTFFFNLVSLQKLFYSNQLLIEKLRTVMMSLGDTLSRSLLA